VGQGVLVARAVGVTVFAAVGVDDGLIAVAVAWEVAVGVAVAVASAAGTSVGLLRWQASNAASIAVDSAPARNARREIFGMSPVFSRNTQYEIRFVLRVP
jgi:hypothetical protein